MDLLHDRLWNKALNPAGFWLVPGRSRAPLTTPPEWLYGAPALFRRVQFPTKIARIAPRLRAVFIRATGRLPSARWDAHWPNLGRLLPWRPGGEPLSQLESANRCRRELVESRGATCWEPTNGSRHAGQKR